MTKQELDEIRERAGIITGPTWQHLYRQADADRAALLAEVDRLHEAFEFAGTGLLQYLKNLQQTNQEESPEAGELFGIRPKWTS